MKHLTLTTQFNRHVFKVVLIISILSGYKLSAQQVNPDKVHLGFIYPLSTHGTHASADTNTFSLNILGGVSAAEKGLAFAGISNVVRYDVNGMCFAGFSNHIGKRAEGMLFAGFVNTYGSGKGLQFAGFSNVASADILGAQFAGFLNKGKNITGAQFGGFANLARHIKGSQFAGFINTAKSVNGSQFAGFRNVTGKSIGGSQFSGFINKADTVYGSQMAGFINIAKKVKGAQIAGFINIADSSDYPVGIINIVKNGEKSIGLTIDDSETTLLSFRSGGKVLYGIIGLGYNFKNDDERYSFEAGLGAHLFNSSTFRINTELATLILESFYLGEYFKSSIRVLPVLKLSSVFEIFAGPSLNFINTNTTEGKNLTRHYLYQHQNRWGNDFQAIYIGYSGGLNIKF